jgi:hypothetical protein
MNYVTKTGAPSGASFFLFYQKPCAIARHEPLLDTSYSPATQAR